MPVIGYFIGYSFKDILEAYIPWIAFSLLTLLAIKSFVEWIIERKKKEEIKEKHISIIDIFIQAISTSIDALCIGFVYLYLDIY